MPNPFKLRVHRVPGFFSVVRSGSPHPLIRKGVLFFPPMDPKGHFSLRGRDGGTKFRRREDTLVLYVYSSIFPLSVQVSGSEFTQPKSFGSVRIRFHKMCRKVPQYLRSERRAWWRLSPQFWWWWGQRAAVYPRTCVRFEFPLIIYLVLQHVGIWIFHRLVLQQVAPFNFALPAVLRIRIRDEQHGSYFPELRNNFFGLKYLNSLMRIRDPG